MPRCPICYTATDPVTYEGVPVQNCGHCGGYWLDDLKLRAIVGRPELQFAPAVAAKLVELAEVSNTREQLFCPTCAKPMIKEGFKFWSGVQLDRCPKCKQIWLDRAELERCQILWEHLKDNPDSAAAETLAKLARLKSAAPIQIRPASSASQPPSSTETPPTSEPA